jgi:hypothetical protein
MPRRLVPSLVATALFGLFASAVAVGCSAAPDATEDSASGASAIVRPTCTGAFEVYEAGDCSPEGIGGKMLCSPGSCASVTLPPTGGPAPTTGPLAQTATTITAPASLAALGCTPGLAIRGYMSVNVWACPSSHAGSIPSNLGAEPTCIRDAGKSCDVTCEEVDVGTTVTSNPFVGSPISGWVLVGEYIEGCYVIGGGCGGGCARIGG